MTALRLVTFLLLWTVTGSIRGGAGSGSGGWDGGNTGGGKPPTRPRNTGNSDDDYHFYGYDPDKNHPENNDCKSFQDRIEDAKNGNFWDAILPCQHSSDDEDSGDDDGIFPVPTPVSIDHYLFVKLYVSLPPSQQSVGHDLKRAVTRILNRASEESQLEVDLEFKKYGSKIVLRLRDRFWWRYKMKYACYVENTTIPINETKMEEIKNEFVEVALDLESVKAYVEKELVIEGNSGNGVIDIQFTHPTPPEDSSSDDPPPPPCTGTSCQPDQPPISKDERENPCGGLDQPPCDPDDCHGEFCSSSSSSSSSSDESSDRGIHTLYPTAASPMSGNMQLGYGLPAEWDWRRYAGLGLLVGTLAGTLCLAQLAGFRRRRRAKKELWGNLATEEGVSELLRTGWKVNGSKMEVYDKKDMGYRDDDSMLIGGFEQKEVIGAEITVTHSETTPDTAFR